MWSDRVRSCFSMCFSLLGQCIHGHDRRNERKSLPVRVAVEEQAHTEITSSLGSSPLSVEPSQVCVKAMS